MILGLIMSKDSIIVIASLQTLTKIIRSEDMRDCWTNFLELIVIKFIETYKVSKEVRIRVLKYKTYSFTFLFCVRFQGKLT